MENKKIFTIYIEGRARGILKKLDKEITLFQVRQLLKNMISDEDLFVGENECEIPKEEENNFSIKEIISNENIIYIRKELSKTIIYLDEKKLVELKIDDEKMCLKNLRKLSDKILENYFFVNKEDNEIEKENEEEFLVKDIIHNGVIKMKNLKTIKQNENNKENNQEKKDEEEKKENNKENIENKNEEENNKENKENNLEDFFIKLDKIFNLLKCENDNKLNEFKEKYGQYKGLKRFAIPIFGVISSGKSTFLNYLLGLNNLLEMNQQISTKFICIIRNKKGLKFPKIYEVKIILREDRLSVNFEKGEEIHKNIKKFISEKNEKIKENKLGRKPENYFVILEADIPFLNRDNNNSYSDLFEFMDFPGLNEEDNNNQNSVDLFYKDFFPLILPNVKFAIFIFDLYNYIGNANKNLINNYRDFYKKYNFPYLEKACIDSFKQSFFILNKIDLDKNNEYLNNNLREFFKNMKIEINEDNFLGISSKEKLIENNKYESFPQFIEYINLDKPLFFNSKLNAELEKELKINNIDELQKDYIMKKDLNDIDKFELKGIKKKILSKNYDFIEKNYKFYKEKFLECIPKNKKFNENPIHILLKKKLLNIYSEYTDLKEMKNYLEVKENKEEENFSDFMKRMHSKIINDNQLYNKDDLFKNFLSIKQYLNIFSSINRDDPIWKKLIDETKKYIDFFSSKLSFRIIILGKYSSGKSSLLNSIIGYNLNILQENKNGCTKNIFIVKYCKDIKNISLFKANMKEDLKNFFLTEELEKITESKENVKNYIIKLNNNIKDTNVLDYYIVKTPIEALDNMNINEEIKDNLEFVDLPGFGFSNNLEKILNQKIINSAEGIIFVNQNALEEDSNLKMIDIILKLKLINTTFFVNTFESQTSIDSCCKILSKKIQEKNEGENFIDIIKNNINLGINENMVSILSNKHYKEYQQIKIDNYNFQNFEELNNHLQNNKTKDFDSYKPNEEKLIQIKKKIFSKFEILDEQKDLVEEACKLYLFIDEIEDSKYEISYAEEFFKKFKNFVDIIKKNYCKHINSLYYNFLLERICLTIKQVLKKAFHLEPKIIPKEEAEGKKNKIIRLIYEFQKDIKNKVSEFKEWNRANINTLKEFCGKEDFEEKFLNFDDKVKIEYDKLEKYIKEKRESLKLNCVKEVENFRKDILKDSFENYILYIKDINKDYKSGVYITIGASIASSGSLVSGILGVIFAGGFLFGLSFLGLIVGGIFSVACAIDGFNFLKLSKKVKHKQFLDMYLNGVDKLDNFLNNIYNDLESLERECSQEIDNINDINMINPKVYLENKNLFIQNVNNLIDLINIK